MSVAYPWALALLLLLPLLWLVRQDPPRRRILVSSVFLWPASRGRDPMWGSRARHHELVWIQSALLAALIAALAGPRVDTSADFVAIVVDTSMSMGARDGQRTRLDAARNRVLDAIDASEWRGTVRVWAADADPVLAGTTTPGPGLEALLESVTTSDGWSNLEAAIGRAGQDGALRIYVVTDQPAVVAPDVEWLTVGSAVANLAVTSLTVTPDTGLPRRARLMAEVRNFGRADTRVEVRLSVADREVGRYTVDLAGSAAVSVSTDADGVDPGVIVSASLDADDALEADNLRRAVAPRPVPVRVALAGRSPFLDAALATLPGINRVASRQDPHDVLVCVDCPGRDVAGEAAVLKAFAAKSGEPGVPITVTRPDHPVVAGVPLDGLVVVPTEGGEVAADAIVVARAGERPAIVVREHATERSVELRFDVADPGLALEPSFPLLVAGAVDVLAAPAHPPSSVRAGDPFEWRLRQPVTEASATGPSGDALPARAASERILVTATRTAGVYRVDAGGERATFVANPATSESNLSAPAPATMGALSAPARTADAASRDLVPWLLAVALALIAWELRARVAMARRAARQAPWPRVAVRVAAIVLVAAAIGKLPIWTGTAPLAVSFVIDQSASAAVNTRIWLDTARRLAATFEPEDRAGVVVFGETAAVERRVQPGGLPAATEMAIGAAGTNIERALQAARTSLPAEGDRRIVLFSDGRQTAGDAVREARQAAGAGVRIDAMPPLGAAPAAARATRLTAPAVVRLDEPFEMRVVVEGDAGTEGTLRLEGPGGVQQQRVVVPTGGAAAATFLDRADTTGVRTYRAAYAVDLPAFGDSVDAFSEIGAIVSVTGRPRALYVGERFGTVAGPLAAAGFQAEAVRPVSMPAKGIDGYDALVLDDVDPLELSPQHRGALARYVDAGGGLLVLGSERSLPPSSGDPDYDAVLPVDPRPRGGERGSAMALVVAFDKSGSMEERVGGTQKIEFARQAVRNVAAALPAGDALGVIAFDSEPAAVAALSASRGGAQLDAALRALRPEGATAIAPALSQAAGWLQAASGAFDRKHVLLVSDGQTFAGDLARARQAVQAGGFVLSVVALGAGPDREALDALARESGGRAYFVDDVRTLPSAVAREAIRVGGGRTVDAGFEARLGSHALARGLAGTPRLGGYVVTAARPGAEVVMRSHLDDPILAVGRSGLGRVAVYTADLHSAWSTPLAQWPGFSPLLARTLRWVSRSAETTGLHASLRATPTSIVVEVETDGAGAIAAEPLDVRGVVRPPAGQASELLFTAVAPGRYQATAPLDGTGAYIASVSASAANGSSQATTVRGMYYTAPQEFDDVGTDLTLLRQMVSITGGRLLPPDAAALDGREAGFRDGRPWFAAAALLLLLGDLLFAGLPRLLLGAIRGPGGAQEQAA
jgi:Ca-activated chloride channel homolog